MMSKHSRPALTSWLKKRFLLAAFLTLVMASMTASQLCVMPSLAQEPSSTDQSRQKPPGESQNPTPVVEGSNWERKILQQPAVEPQSSNASQDTQELSLQAVAGLTFSGGIAAYRMPGEDGGINDGRIEVFAVGNGGSVYHKYQVNPNSGWSAWKSLGGVVDPFFYSISVAPNLDGRLTIFVVGTDGGVWFKFQTQTGKNAPESWSVWHTLGKPDGVGLVSAPVAVLNKRSGCIEVFARNFTYAHKLHRRAQTKPNNGWGNWETLLVLGNTLGDTLNAVNHEGSKKTAIFTDDTIHLERQFAPKDNPYSFIQMPNSMLHIVAESNYNDSIGIVGVNYNGLIENAALFTNEAAFSGWGGMNNGRTYHKPALVRDVSNRLNVFVHGTDHRIYWSWQKYPASGVWAPWILLDRVFGTINDSNANPAAAVNDDGRLEVFVLGTDRQIYHAYEQTYPGGPWTRFVLL